MFFSVCAACAVYSENLMFFVPWVRGPLLPGLSDSIVLLFSPPRRLQASSPLLHPPTPRTSRRHLLVGREVLHGILRGQRAAHSGAVSDGGDLMKYQRPGAHVSNWLK